MYISFEAQRILTPRKGIFECATRTIYNFMGFPLTAPSEQTCFSSQHDVVIFLSFSFSLSTPEMNSKLLAREQKVRKSIPDNFSPEPSQCVFAVCFLQIFHVVSFDSRVEIYSFNECVSRESWWGGVEDEKLIDNEGVAYTHIQLPSPHRTLFIMLCKSFLN